MPRRTQSGSPLVTLVALFASSVLANTGVAQSFDKIFPSQPVEFGYFGRSIALDDGVAIIGARNAAYIFDRDGDRLIQRQRLTPSTPRPYAYFGWSVAIADSVAVVGAIGGDSSGTAHVFRLRSGEWLEEQVLTASDDYPRNSFGDAICIAGQDVIVSASDFPSGDRPGSVYVFRSNHGGLFEAQRIRAPLVHTGAGFGRTLACNQNQLFVGAPLQGMLEGSSGAVYSFEKSGDSWQASQFIALPDRQTSDSFGHSLALVDDKLLIGNPGDDSVDTNVGAVFLFGESAQGWQPSVEVHPYDSVRWAFFGRTVALNSNHVFVASQLISGRSLTGAVYVMRKVGATWVTTAKLRDSGSRTSYGDSISADDSLLLVGAPSDPEKGTRVGAVYAYRIEDVVVARSDSWSANDSILARAFPNPFRSRTTIAISLTRGAHVTMSVFDSLGRHVFLIRDSYFPSGRHELELDGSRLASGVYHVLIRSSGVATNAVIVKAQ